MKKRYPTWTDPEPLLRKRARAGAREVLGAIEAEAPGSDEFAALLSTEAAQHLELMAAKALRLTQSFFGRTIALYVPLYISNYCSGGCAYCGFAADRRHTRRRLELPTIAAEMDALRRMGFEEILLLTGERTPQAGFEYLRDAVALAAERFSTVTIEAFSMSEAEYRALTEAGCTGLTIYQETYDPVVYDRMHRWGPKKDYMNRLLTPERALEAGMRSVGMGILLGLADPIKDAMCLYLHLDHLRRKHWQAAFSISFPRIRPQAGGFTPPAPVGDPCLAQLIFAFRICLPEMHLVLSTRESASFRDGIAGTGISKMSIASKTTVGGYRGEPLSSEGQFRVEDARSIKSFNQALRAKGLLPVFKHSDAVFGTRPAGNASALKDQL